jgi:hypothetical protein
MRRAVIRTIETWQLAGCDYNLLLTTSANLKLAVQ